MTNDDIRRMAEDSYRTEVLSARKMSAEEKLLAGAQLFDYACGITLAGIRFQHPEASEERVQEILRERLAWAERNPMREP